MFCRFGPRQRHDTEQTDETAENALIDMLTRPFSQPHVYTMLRGTHKTEGRRTRSPIPPVDRDFVVHGHCLWNGPTGYAGMPSSSRDDDEINPADEPKDAVQLLVEAIIWSKMLLMRMRKPP